MTSHNNSMKDEASSIAESTNPAQQSTNEGAALLDDSAYTGNDGSNDIPDHFLSIERFTVLIDRTGKFLGANIAGAHGPLNGSKCSGTLQGFNDWVEGIDHTFSHKFVNRRSEYSSKNWYGQAEKDDEKFLHDLMKDQTNRYLSRIQNESGQPNRPVVTVISKRDASLYNSLMDASEEVQCRDNALNRVQDRLGRSANYPLEYREPRWYAGNDHMAIKKYKDTYVGYRADLNWDDIDDSVTPRYLSKLDGNLDLLKPVGPEPGSTFMGHIVTGADLPETPNVDLSEYKAHTIYDIRGVTSSVF